MKFAIAVLLGLAKASEYPGVRMIRDMQEEPREYYQEYPGVRTYDDIENERAAYMAQQEAE